jgi:CheY-like chemotaxis protein
MHVKSKNERPHSCTEDDADSRALIVFVLTREGNDVTATENSTDALALVKLERFDLLLIDNWCPDYQGWI